MFPGKLNGAHLKSKWAPIHILRGIGYAANRLWIRTQNRTCRRPLTHRISALNSPVGLYKWILVSQPSVSGCQCRPISACSGRLCPISGSSSSSSSGGGNTIQPIDCFIPAAVPATKHKPCLSSQVEIFHTELVEYPPPTSFHSISKEAYKDIEGCRRAYMGKEARSTRSGQLKAGSAVRTQGNT
jgi:hypothetical protein